MDAHLPKYSVFQNRASVKLTLTEIDQVYIIIDILQRMQNYSVMQKF